MADLQARATAAVDIEILSPRRIGGLIAVNPGFRPREISQLHGVGIEKPEVDPAQEAVVRETLAALGSALPVLSIQDWIERESKARGGKGQLTAALLGIPYKRGAMGKNKKYMATLRAIERSAKATKTGRKEEHHGLGQEYRQIIGNFTEGALGNPYAPTGARARAALRRSRAQLSILGDWTISKRTYTFAWKGTELEPAETFARVWSLPTSFIADTLAIMGATTFRAVGSSDEGLVLDWVYALSIIIELPEE